MLVELKVVLEGFLVELKLQIDGKCFDVLILETRDCQTELLIL